MEEIEVDTTAGVTDRASVLGIGNFLWSVSNNGPLGIDVPMVEVAVTLDGDTAWGLNIVGAILVLDGWVLIESGEVEDTQRLRPLLMIRREASGLSDNVLL